MMRASAVTPISGIGNSWKVAEPSDPPSSIGERPVSPAIEGDEKIGYHLIISPEGCFTADTWHESIADAKATARAQFGVAIDGWS